jgi:hypothetical protein
MAKKSRRAKRRAEKRRNVAAVRPKPSVSVPSPAVAKKEEIEPQAAEKTAQLAEEYRYVYSDLKRVAILAASMLAVLIILSFVIR